MMRTHCDINLVIKVPHLVKLGVRMEFRDSLNKCALALAKNLDRSKLLFYGVGILMNIIQCQEDRTRTERFRCNWTKLERLGRRLSNHEILVSCIKWFICFAVFLIA